MKADHELAQVYASIRNTKGTKQAGKAAVNLKLIKRMVDTVEGTLTAARDRALILIGFAGGLRRSEVAGICFEHLQWHSSGSGITITLPKPKTDQSKNSFATMKVAEFGGKLSKAQGRRRTIRRSRSL